MIQRPITDPGPTDRERRNWRLFNGRQIDPTTQGARAGSEAPHFRRKGTDRVLMPDSFMPLGTHRGKHMRAVPLDYLLWVDSQHWSRSWPGWETVHDFMDRFIVSDPETVAGLPEVPSVPIYTDELRIYPDAGGPFKAGSSHLHTLPGWEDFLHAFAVGCLGLKTEWYQMGALPHYDLSKAKHILAVQNGAELIRDRQIIDHRQHWTRFFQSRPTYQAEPK